MHSSLPVRLRTPISSHKGKAPTSRLLPGKIGWSLFPRVFILMICIGTLLGSTSAQAADPFYENLLRDGIEAAAAGESERARESLHLACFGLLEELEPLTDCLVRLAMAESAGGDVEAFRQTFGRILEIEERFSAYSGASLPSPLRRAFEAESARQIPEALLNRVEAFRPLAQSKQLSRLDGLPVSEQRQRLEAMIAASPESSEWRRRLARLELDAGQPGAAINALGDGASGASADQGEACLRAEADLALGRCAASERFIACPRARLAENADRLLECWSRSEEWDAAQAFLRTLPSDVQQRRTIQRWDKRVQKEARKLARQNAAAQRDEGNKPAQPTAEALNSLPEVQKAPTPSLPDEAKAELERARQLLASAKLAEDLDDAFALATEVADAYPQHQGAQHLAAEIAYRASRWSEAASYFRRGGDPGDDHPVRLFFMAVSFYESGDTPAAEEALRRSLPSIQRTAYVESYVERIFNQNSAGDRS